jgi:hypothetical protein
MGTEQLPRVEKYSVIMDLTANNEANVPPRRGSISKYPGTRQYGARFALTTLFVINLLNYADRYVPSSVKALFQDELQLTDFQTSLPTTGKKEGFQFKYYVKFHKCMLYVTSYHSTYYNVQ